MYCVFVCACLFVCLCALFVSYCMVLYGLVICVVAVCDCVLLLLISELIRLLVNR